MSSSCRLLWTTTRLPALQFGYMLALAYGGAWLANVTVTAVLQ